MQERRPTFADPSTGTRYCLPHLERAVNGESAPGPRSDVDDVLLAFDLTLDAAPRGAALLLPWTKWVPHLADDLIAVASARALYGWTLTDFLKDAPEDPEVIAMGREVLARLLPTARTRRERRGVHPPRPDTERANEP